MPLAHQEHGEDHNAGVADDGYFDEQAGVVLGGQPPEENGEGEGHELSQKQSQQQAGGVQPQSRAVGSGHIDDGVHAVDEEEKGQQIYKNVLFLLHVFQGSAQLAEAVQKAAVFRGDKGGLVIPAEQRKRAADPPQGGDEEGNDHGASLGQAEDLGHQHQNQADDEGNHGADVAEGIAQGGDLVHPGILGDLRQHGIIEHQAGGVTHPGENEDAQEAEPARSQP